MAGQQGSLVGEEFLLRLIYESCSHQHHCLELRRAWLIVRDITPGVVVRRVISVTPLGLLIIV
jgi:hypothetical protein